jgi:hypothetical protein
MKVKDETGYNTGEGGKKLPPPTKGPFIVIDYPAFGATWILEDEGECWRTRKSNRISTFRQVPCVRMLLDDRPPVSFKQASQ